MVWYNEIVMLYGVIIICHPEQDLAIPCMIQYTYRASEQESIVNIFGTIGSVSILFAHELMLACLLSVYDSWPPE